MLKEWSYQQVRLASLWLGEQWNQPSRADHYVMQIAYVLYLIHSKTPGSVSFDKMKIRFRKQDAEPLDPKQQMEWSKAVWFGAMGIKRPRPSEPLDEIRDIEVDRYGSIDR